MISWPLIVAGSTFSISLLHLVTGINDGWISPVADKLVQGHHGPPRFQHTSVLRGIITCGLCLLLTYILVTQVEGMHVFLTHQTNARANSVGITDDELRRHAEQRHKN